MRRKASMSFKGVTSEVLGVLSDEWQTGRLIAAQIVFPPDVLARLMIQSLRLNGGVQTESGRKSFVVARTLTNLVSNGTAEKRKISSAINEYRLAQKKRE